MRRTIERKPRGEYHHGNLRRALVDGAVVMLADTDPDAISLRALARKIGVDHSAAYRYFADREALLAEVAEEGYLALIEAVEAALADAPARAAERLAAFARAYVQMAMREPGRYRAMIRPRLVEKRDRPKDSGDAALAVLEREIAAGATAGELVVDDVREVAVGLWSAMHGVASLIATRRLYVRKDLVVPYAGRLFERTLRGIVRG